jgi:signal peptidase II
MPNQKKGQLRWLWIAVAVIVSDFVCKFLAVKYLSYGIPKKIFPGFELTLLHNYGAAFSFLDSQPGWQVFVLAAIAVIVSLVILVWIARLDRKDNLMAIGLCLILGGALGNLYDRLVYGYVVDFIDVYFKSYHWPAFNIADTGICIGAFFVILATLFNSKKNK